MNMIEDIINKVIMEYVFLEEPPSEYTSLKENLGIDSLRIVEFIIKLEENFDILIGESDLDPSLLITVDDIYRLIHKYIE